MDKNLTTKERLIQAASVIFAEKGYRDTTVAEICDAAGANIAAVNYHFGDKSNLYCQVWEYLFEQSAAKYPLPTDLIETDPEAWLRHFIRSRVEQIFDTDIHHRLPQLLHREMGEPTEMHESLFEKYLQPSHQRVSKAIRLLIGPGISENQLKLAHLNFMSLHIFLNVGHQKNKTNCQCRHRLPSTENPAELARQVEAFAIGGLLATRDLIHNTGNLS
ncbi:TetR/AcrR family transcriptional regulator [Pontiella sulfatireligans]|uniref:Putative HTH-type transcriptional regulator YbiH n=1 Tax=Pontiella sulfatireligans TaxID=2750658 RepID=A0A6C2UTU2_9BACT|nr:TetR/AcrR family transcriptional regulator [Pontiella sulfatireligans]VGO22654.1 putative HTH-type transcriptional regulator YbiH [Pontiella sulfatireligans]